MDHFDQLEPTQKMQLEVLSRLAFNTRDARAGLLAYHGVSDESVLRERIVSGEIDEHPGWEHYVGARAMTMLREAARAGMAGDSSPLDTLPALRVRDALGERFSSVIAGSIEARFDALELSLNNGLVLTLHIASSDEYSFAWRTGDNTRRAILDTAPCHGMLAGAPVHLHRANGNVTEDTLTRIDADPVDNACALVAALVANPRFALEE